MSRRPVRRRSFTSTLALAAVAALAACGPAPTGGRSRRDGGTGAGGDDVDLSVPGGSGGADLRGGGGGSDGGGTGPVDPGPGNDTCSEQQFAPMKLSDPDIILVQDKSGSMSEGTPSKYTQMTNAVGSVITQLEQQNAPIHWGLILFPSNNDCAVANQLPVPVGQGQGAAVVAAIRNNSPNGNTPLAKAIEVGTNYYQSLNDGRAHILLAATDGEPNCDAGGALPRQCTSNAQCGAGETCQMLPFIGGICTPSNGGMAAQAVAAARAKGIRTYVIGISLGGSSMTLNALADAGGTARAGGTKYYDVSDQAQLETALKNISTQVISCTFTLQALPMANQKVVVTISGAPVPRDPSHTDGWDLDSMSKTITFYGNACTSLQSNPGVVSVGYTCPPPG